MSDAVLSSLPETVRAERASQRAIGATLTESTPSLTVSIIIAAVNPVELLVPGLVALERQQPHPPDEIIVVTRHSAVAQERLRQSFPGVTVVAAPPRTTIPLLLAIGARRAAGEVLVITEDHCVPGPYWLATIVAAVGDGALVVGGPVENASSTHRQRDWAAFLTEYAPFILAADGAAPPELPGNNIAFHRALREGLVETLERDRWGGFYTRTLGALGVPMRFAPEMVIYHRRPFNVRYFLRQRYHFSRAFAGMRCQQFGTGRRLAYGLGSLLLPPLLTGRGLRTIWRKGRHVGRYLSCLPLIVLYFTVGAFGEMTGYLLGGGNSLECVE